MANLNTSLYYAAQVFSGCGKPSLGRRRRDTTELEFESLQFGRSETDHNGDSNDVPTLDKLVKDIREKVRCKIYCFFNNLFHSNDALSHVCVGTLQVQPKLEAWVPPLCKMYVVTHRIVTHS